ncbi:hypothetical protein FACS189438_2790 [Bacteroidia bacterium]|nr:hypothetical protein FACS189438_2790 [Bacteroidia bacterium]
MKHVLKIAHWLLDRFRDAEHVQFVFAILVHVRVLLTDLPVADVMLDNILVHYTREEKAFKRVHHEALTGELKDLDEERDDLYMSLQYMLKAALRSHNPALTIAAKVLDELFRSYKKIMRVNYEAETALVRHFLADLAKPQFAAAATLLGFDPLSANLLAVNNTFDEKWIARLEAEGGDLLLGNVRQTRPAVNHALFALFDTLNALYASNESVGKDPVLREKLTAAINFINEEIHANVNVLANRGQHYPGKTEDLFDANMHVDAPAVPLPPAPAPDFE